MPVSRGRVPAAEAFAPELKLSLEQIEDVYDRQVFLLDWFFQQYLTYLPAKQILFYEATINTAGRSLAVINPLANQLTENLYSKNNNSLYNAALKQTFLDKLLSKTEGAFWHFYTEEQLMSI